MRALKLFDAFASWTAIHNCEHETQVLASVVCRCSAKGTPVLACGSFVVCSARLTQKLFSPPDLARDLVGEAYTSPAGCWLWSGQFWRLFI
jgi:hypothetical protein